MPGIMIGARDNDKCLHRACEPRVSLKVPFVYLHKDLIPPRVSLKVPFVYLHKDLIPLTVVRGLYG